MHFYNTFIFFIFVVLLSGCGSSAPKPAEVKVVTPKWVNSIPPSDTSSKIYGMGIGKNRESAINEALNDMISKLGVSIESSFESYQKVETSYSNSKVESTIKADVSKVKINNYQVIKSHRINYREFAVMIEVDKQKLASGLLEKLEIDKQSINQRLNSSSSLNYLSRYNTSKQLAKEAKALVPVILILKQLDESFNLKQNMEYASSVEEIFLKVSNNLKFYVSGNSKSAPFIEKIKNNLAQQGFKISNTKKNAINIRLQTSDNINNKGISIVAISIGIDVYDKSERIGGQRIIVKERYNSLSNVYKNAAIHFAKDIEAKGINELIGINLNIDE